MLAGCGSSRSGASRAAGGATQGGETQGGATQGGATRGGETQGGGTGVAASKAHPQAIEPTVGETPAAAVGGRMPVGDPNAHPVSLAEVKRELRIVRELNSLGSGHGFVFPIEPRSVVEPPSRSGSRH